MMNRLGRRKGNSSSKSSREREDYSVRGQIVVLLCYLFFPGLLCSPLDVHNFIKWLLSPTSFLLTLGL